MSDNMLLEGEQDLRIRQPAAAAPRSDFLLDGEQPPSVQALSSVRSALGTNPDEAARAKTLATSAALPVATVQRNYDEVQRVEKLRQIQGLMASSPILARQLSDPTFAALSHDDAPNLSFVESTVKAFKQSYLGASVVSGLHSAMGAAATLVDDLNPFTLSAQDAATLYKDRPDKLREVRNTSAAMFLSRFANSQQDASSDVMANVSPENKVRYGELKYATTDPEQAAYLSPVKMLGDVVQSLPTTAALALSVFLTRGAAFRAEQQALAAGMTPQGARAAAISEAASTMARVGALSEGSIGYAAQKNQTTQAGNQMLLSELEKAPEYAQLTQQGYSPEAAVALMVANTAQQSGLIAGGVDAVTNLVGGRVLGRIIGEGGRLLPRVAKGFATEAVTESIQSGGEQLGQNYAMRQHLNPNQALTQDVLENMLQGLAIGGLTGGAFSGMAGNKHRADAATANAQTLDKVTEAATASKLRARDPDSFQSFVKAAAADGPVQDVFISAEALAQSGVDVAALAQASPAVAQQLEEVATTGGDLVIPIEEYAARLAGTDMGKALQPHLRTDPEAMSPAEAQAFYQTPAEDHFKIEMEHLAAEQAADLAGTGFGADGPLPVAADTVRQRVLEQLQQTGRFTADVNAHYADLMGSFFTTMAERVGVTPEALLQQFPVKIVSNLGVSGPVLNQNIRDGSDPKGTTVPDSSAGAGAGQHDAGTNVPTLQQSTGKDRGAFDPSTKTIALLADADLSSFLHEGAHFYLEVLTDVAARAEASAQVKADMQQVLAWFGVADLAKWRSMTLEEKRPFHEQFARGFEAYLFEGKTPSVELQGAFQRFRSWLMHVYKSLASLNVKLSDDVRSVFDRLLATDAQIQMQQSARAYAPLFDSATSAGMTPEQWQQYEALGKDATNSATEQLQRRSLRDMQWMANAKGREVRRLQREGKHIRTMVMAEVHAELVQQPVYVAMRWLKHGETTTADGEEIKAEKGFKLDTEALQAMYPKTMLARPDVESLGSGKGGLTSKDGLHPDMVAQMFGFSSGDELVRKLLDAEPESAAIERLTDQRMLERYGDLTDPQTVQRAAEAAIHNDARTRFLEREVNQLSAAVGDRPLLARAARAYAEQSIAQQAVHSVRPSQYAVAEARAGKGAAKEFKAGNTPAAAQHKRAQLLNHQFQRVATDVRDEIGRGLNYMRDLDNIGTRKAIGPEYSEQIDTLLERHDLRVSITRRAIERRQSLLQWVEAQRELGFEPAIDERLLAEAQRQHYTDMTVEEFRGLVDTVRNIEHLGRLKHRLLTARDERDFDTAVADAAVSIGKHATHTIKQKIESQLPRDQAGKLYKQFVVGHRKLASLVRQMDGVKDGGVLWTLIVRTMNDAGNRESVQRETATMQLAKLFEPLNKEGGLFKKQYIPAINASLSKMGRLSIALNMGNATNRQRLLDGERWTPAQLKAVLDTVTPEQWDFVQGVWDYIGSYWPQIAAKEQRVSGIAPQQVDPTPYAVYDVQGNLVRSLRGGYYPIKYDAERSTRAGADSIAEAVKQSMQGLYTRATTRRGHTKARVETVNRAMRKDFGVIFEHVEQVIHDLSYHEWLIDANRLLRADPIDAAIRRHYGPETLQTMSAALTDIAKGDVPAQNAFEKGINHLRQGVTIAGLGWNLMTSLMQPLGLTQSMVRVGPKWIGKGLSRWLGDAVHMQNTVTTIYERSDFMRLRGKTMQREINEIRNKVNTENGMRSAIEASYFYLIAKAQMIADVPTWLGAYEKAAESRADEAKAIALADQAVLDSQGGGQVKDLAEWQRGGPLQKLFTNFYSYFNTTFNLTAEAIASTDFKSPVAVGRLAVDFLLLYSLPVVLGTLMKSALKGDDDDGETLAKKLAREQLSYMMGTMMGLRELSAAVSGGFGYQGPTGTRFFSEATRLGKQIQQGEVDKALLKAANSTAGIFLHYPAGQVQRTVEGVIEVTEHDAGPQAVLLGPGKR